MEVFPKQKWKCFQNENRIVFKTKMFLFRKHLQSESVFEMKVKGFWNENILICNYIWKKFVFFCFYSKKKSHKENFLGLHAWTTIDMSGFANWQLKKSLTLII